MRLKSLICASALCVAATAVNAEPVNKAEEWVQFFIESAELGQARALCIGTRQECEAKQNAPLASRDMKVNFEYNSATLTPEAREELKHFAAAVNDYRLAIATFKVEGHTDAHGGNDFNYDLSTRRAQAVTETLVSYGVDPARIEAQGFGESAPVSSDPYAPENRRVETRLVMPAQ